MKNQIKILFLSIAIASSLLPINAASAASTTSIKNLYMTITYPSTVKMVKAGCGTVKVQYKVGLKASKWPSGFGQIAFLIDGELAAASIVERNPASGTVALKYCRDDWENADGDVFYGMIPGSHEVQMYTYFDSQVTKSGLIKFTK